MAENCRMKMLWQGSAAGQSCWPDYRNLERPLAGVCQNGCVSERMFEIYKIRKYVILKISVH